MVHASLRMLIPRRSRGDALSILRDFARSARFEPGCVSCRVYRDADEVDGILLDEQWEGAEELAQHLRSADFRNVLVVLDLSLAPPEIKFETVERTTGIETIAEARTSATEHPRRAARPVHKARASHCHEEESK